MALRNARLRARQETIQCASMVVLSGYLEAFIRDLSKAFFDTLKARGTGLQVLAAGEPETKFTQTHLRNGARILMEMAKGKDANLTDCEQFIKKLYAPFTNEGEPPSWEAFAVTEANPGPRVLKDFLKSLGIADPFAAVSVAAKTRYSAANFDTQLSSFIALRNECAHTGKARTVPEPQTIEDYVDVLRALTLGMCKVLNARASSL